MFIKPYRIIRQFTCVISVQCRLSVWVEHSVGLDPVSGSLILWCWLRRGFMLSRTLHHFLSSWFGMSVLFAKLYVFQHYHINTSLAWRRGNFINRSLRVWGIDGLVYTTCPPAIVWAPYTGFPQRLIFCGATCDVMRWFIIVLMTYCSFHFHVLCLFMDVERGPIIEW